jgi:hypothetical protein
MPVTIKIRDFIENALNIPMDFNANTFMIALSNTPPGIETVNPTLDGNGVLANVTQIAYGANYTDTLSPDRTLGSITSNATGGTYTFDAADFTITAGGGGSIPTFQYIYVYNDTPTSPADPLVLCINNETPISLAAGQSITISFDLSGIFTIV